MQKLHTTLVILVLFIGSTFARTPQEAAYIASEFVNQRHQTTSSIQRIKRAANASGITAPVSLAYTHLQKDGSTPAVYVFNSKEEGFVLVSAEDNARAVLGYADQGYFDPQNIPSNMQVWLQMYAEELAYAALSPQAKSRPELGTQYPTIEPLLGETQWGQGKPYNNHCPKINGELSVTGCVATALSQIMYKHKYPKQGIGNHSYKLRNGIVVSADFSQTTYDWDNMLPRYTGSYTTKQADAVAELMFHVGVSCDMQYSPVASGSASGAALKALNRYFNYDAGIKPLLKDYMPESEVLDGIATDLKAGYPVYISATTTNWEGHAFVCDGMQSNGFIHINWGWTGTSDGYFSISALDPGQQGTGGSSSNLAFTVDVCAYANIRPNENGTANPIYTANALTRTSAQTMSKLSNVKYSLYIFCNNGITDSSIKLGYSIYNTNDELVANAGFNSKFNLGPSYYVENYSVNYKIPGTLSDGDYYLVVGYKDTKEQIHPVLIKGKGIIKNAFTIQGGNIYFKNQTDPQLPDTLAADFTQISGTNTWQMDLYTPNFWEGDATDDLLIRCNLNSNSTTSVIGTYLLDKSSSATSNSIHLKDVVCAIGNGTECHQYTPNDLQLTLVHDNDGLGVYYILDVNFKQYSGYAHITTPTWSQEINGEDQPYHTNIDYTPATALTAIRAKEIAKQHTDTKSMEYLIQGIVSNVISKPATVLQEQEAQFTISANGDHEDSFLCNHVLWLNQSPYTTGDEIQSGDSIAILGTLTTTDNVPQVNGTTYLQQRPAWEKPISELLFYKENMKMIAQWEGDAKYFKIRLYDQNNKRIADNTINKKNITATLPEMGTYTFWVRPMDNKKKEYVGPALERTFVIDGTSADTEMTYVQGSATLYDLLGNIIDTREDGNIDQLKVPHTGIYILKTNETKVVFLYK